MLGGVEAGGTKFVCAVADDGAEPLELERFPTTTPAETLDRTAAFFAGHGVRAIGVGSFGPLDLAGGRITTTPKPGWAGTELVATLAAATGVPVLLDTDVNAAALAEWRHGAGRGLRSVSYVTVGTGIGCGSIVDGRLLHGLSHPELGHIRIPHDRARDPFDGVCPYHGDCFEGLACGEAMRARFGRPAETIADEEAWSLEIEYLALGLAALVYAVSPERIVLGGGVGGRDGLHARVHARLCEVLAGYAPDATLADGFVAPPALGDRAGVLGAIELARAHVGR